MYFTHVFGIQFFILEDFFHLFNGRTVCQQYWYPCFFSPVLTRLQANCASKPRSAHSTKMMRYNIIIANCDCLCGLAEDAGSLGFAFSYCCTVFAQIIFGTSQRGVGSLYRRIPSSEVGLWVRHKYMNLKINLPQFLKPYTFFLQEFGTLILFQDQRIQPLLF